MSDSIKVAIKVRPLIKREKDENLPIQWAVQGNTIVAMDSEIRKRGDNGFQFDHIFDMNSNNSDVFDSIVMPIVNAAVNGFNGTVFAYGQTSSGKTYTMMGTSEESGIIPLAVEHMFDAITNTPGREFLLRVSYLEIYNEKINDLLSKNGTDLKVHEDANGQVVVKCKEEITNSPENVLSIMNKGNKNRRIGETNMNERSSRSHTIFRITIESREASAGSDGAIQVSQLNLVDLAGSERAWQTGATRERLKEGCHINLSLSTLALVIKQLSESQEKYINFRDSKLTRLLQVSLGGNAMTAMLCTVTPVALDETQCTLSFASRARNVKNKPELNEVMSDGVLLKRYAKQIDKLHTELERMKQLTRSTNFQEMESKIQEKDRINQILEERISLLQTRIVHGDNCNNTELFKCKEKRRRTWCGTGGHKLNTPLFQPRAGLSPIKEMSPVKSHNRKSTDIMDESFQIAFTDFELELLESEAHRAEENDSDDDSFVTYRKHNCVKFTNDVIIHNSSIKYDNCKTTVKKSDTATQTTGNQSPDTPKQALRNKIRYLMEEYSQLQEFTTLEKQLYIKDQSSEFDEKLARISMLEKQLENTTFDKNGFEYIISELRQKLNAAELRYNSAEDQLNAHKVEMQRISDLEKKITQLSTQEIEMQNILQLQEQIAFLTAEKDGYKHVASELRKKFNEAEQCNVMLKEKLTTQNVGLDKSLIQFLPENENMQLVKLETQITTVIPEKDDLQCEITGFQTKLTETELCSMKDKLDEQQRMLQDLQNLKEQINSLTSENNVFESIACEMENKLKEVKKVNYSIREQLNEQQPAIEKYLDQEKQIEQLVLEKHEFELIISKLKEELIEAKITINTMEDKINEQQDASKLQDLQKQINDIVKEKVEFEQINGELTDKLRETELMNTSMKSELVLYEQKTCDYEKQVENLTIKKNEFEDEVVELKEKLKEAELVSSSLKNQLNEHELGTCKIENLEITNRTSVSKNNIIFELEEKLKKTEVYNNSIKEKLSIQQIEMQKAMDEQKKCSEYFTVEQNKLEDEVRELHKKLKEMEFHNNLMKDRIDEQELQLQKTHDLEKEIEYLTSEIKKFKSMIHELQEKLTKAEHYTSVEDESDKQLQLRRIQELEAQIAKLTFERDEYDQISMKLRKQSIKSPKKELMSDCSSYDEINDLKSCINDLQNIQDIQIENTHLKEQASASLEKQVTILDHECNLSNGDSSKIEDLSITMMSLEEDSAKLSADLILKNQELDEIKHDVQSLKADIENLQKTIYLLTIENSELANKLSAEKECAEKSAINFQQTIDDLYVRNSKIMDEKLNLESNLAILNEQMENLRSRIPEVNLNEEQIIIKYEKEISTLTAKNTELLSNLTDTMKELETLKESKSLLYEHDCMYKDKLTNFIEKYEHLTVENNELSIDLMDKIEENDGLRQECDLLKNKLDLLLKNEDDIGNSDIEQLKMKNTLFKTEMMELKANMKVLTEENLKISNQLMETIEDLDNARNINSCNNSLHLLTLFNNSLTTNDAMDKSIKNDNAEVEILNMQEKVNYLTHLNRKLSDMKLSTCIQCNHLKELSESRRTLKLEVKDLSHRLEDLQRKFVRESAKRDALILKAKEDVNISVCNVSFNASFSENFNVSYVEERLQSLNNELQTLKEDRNKLSDMYKEKCNEIEELQNSTVIDSASTNDVNSSIKKSPNKTSSRLENIVKVMNDLRNDFEKIKESNVSVKADLSKFINEKESLLDEINLLKTTNEQLLQKLAESKLLHTTAQEKTDILENEVIDMTKRLQELTIKCKEIENTKLFLEVEIGSLKEDKEIKEQTVNELRQSLSCLEYELDLIKQQKEKLKNDNNILEQEFEKKLELLKTRNEELTNSETIISQKFADYSKESENRLIELNEKLNKYTIENDYLKQELIKLRDIENKFKEMKNEYQSKSQQDKILINDNKKLKNILNNVSENIIKEIKSLKRKIDTQEFLDKSIDELFQIFLQTILAKEKEILKTMQQQFDKEKQKLEDEKRQSVDAEKRITLWAKELESEMEKLQGDLSERETVSDGLQKEIERLGHLLKENNCERDALKEKICMLDTDLNYLHTELDKYCKIDTVNEGAIAFAQKREKQAEETIKKKEAEFQIKLKSEKEAYNKRIEDLICTVESLKTKNMELTSNIEGLEANQEQLTNIIELKTNELMKNNQIIQEMQTELKRLTEAYNDLNDQLEEKKLHIAEISKLLKTKNDELTEYKTNLETIVPENKFLKQQINERKVSIEQYKVKIETLNTESKKEIDAIKDKLNFEELRSIELNKQITELNKKNIALTEELNNLRDDYTTLQHKCITLEKRVRNSTSKILVEEQMEELKDLHRSLRNNLEGASNRITELQDVKTDLMERLVILNCQYDTACKDNQELKQTLSLYKSKYNDTYATCEKYDALLQEKNKIALELEAIKVQLNEKNKDIENYTSKIKKLTEKNTELDQESEELAEVIREYDAENARFQDQFYTCRNEVDMLKDKIKVLEKENENIQSQKKMNVSSNRLEKFDDDECSCMMLKNKIRELQLEIVSKNGKLATLELQIRSGSFPYQEKCKELQEHLSAYKNKNSELKTEVKRLQMALLRTSAKECDVCKQRLVNRRNQMCQTKPNDVIRFTSTSSGIIEDDARITKLEKEKQIMKDVCRSRSKTIKEQQKRIQECEKQIQEYENSLHSKNL